MSKKYQDILYPLLRKHKIKYEYTPIKLSRNLLRLKNGEWNSLVKSFQVVDIRPPERDGGRSEVHARDADNDPFVLGTIESGFAEQEYIGDAMHVIGILLDLKTWTSKGANYGDYYLKELQPLIVLDVDEIPANLSSLFHHYAGGRRSQLLRDPGRTFIGNSGCGCLPIIAIIGSITIALL